MGQGRLLVTPQNSQPLPRAQASLFALESFRRTERVLRGEWGAELSQEKCAASREAPEVVELHLPGACEGAVAHKTFTDVSHGKNISVIFSLCFILYVWNMLLLKALLAGCLAWNQKKNPEYLSAVQILVKIGLILAKGCKGFEKNTHKCTWKFLHEQWDFVSSTSTWNSWKRVTVRIIPRF